MFVISETARRSGKFTLYHTPGYGRPGSGWTPLLCSRDHADIIWWKGRFQTTENLMGYSAAVDESNFWKHFDPQWNTRRVHLATL